MMNPAKAKYCWGHITLFTGVKSAFKHNFISACILLVHQATPHVLFSYLCRFISPQVAPPHNTLSCYLVSQLNDRTSKASYQNRRWGIVRMLGTLNLASVWWPRMRSSSTRLPCWQNDNKWLLHLGDAGRAALLCWCQSVYKLYPLPMYISN